MARARMIRMRKAEGTSLEAFRGVHSKAWWKNERIYKVNCGHFWFNVVRYLKRDWLKIRSLEWDHRRYLRGNCHFLEDFKSCGEQGPEWG